ncbi:hypothetical protein O4J56_19945 [Nocardiopsis sp. RSe5-2]|uniref:Uncharacterized protein n=1 Tax=Nocardiopsis endophytica TaxID=3018445 RepID=A0ABT4U7J3_9ACTN|nr:hypothetical protein [Nocardiopsis endophytica]MDA2812928.1 hypothetical protein [Nocardiopsis endophytica]
MSPYAAYPRGARDPGWAPLGAAAAAIALPLLAWPLAGTLLPDSSSVPSDRPVVLGESEDYEATARFERGWSQLPAESTEGELLVYRRGRVLLQIRIVRPPPDAPEDARDLWKGLERITRATEPSARFGEPSEMTADEGAQGLKGPVEGDTVSGKAAVFPSPGGGFAVEFTATADPYAAVHDVQAADHVMGSVAFSEEDG